LRKHPLIKALERLSVLADQKEKTVLLYLNSLEEKLLLSIAREFGKGKEEIAANTEKDLHIAFDIKYLLSGVKSVASERVQIHFTQSDGPAVSHSFGNRNKPNLLMDSKYLLMPMQIGALQ
jgi:DNA polymerase-3 subunit beta